MSKKQQGILRNKTTKYIGKAKKIIYKNNI